MYSVCVFVRSVIFLFFCMLSCMHVGYAYDIRSEVPVYVPGTVLLPGGSD